MTIQQISRGLHVAQQTPDPFQVPKVDHLKYLKYLVPCQESMWSRRGALLDLHGSGLWSRVFLGLFNIPQQTYQTLLLRGGWCHENIFFFTAK